MMRKYDFLIVGAGIYGSVFAHEVKKAGKTCIVIERRDHVAGNMYTSKVEGINVHKYGAHIFHTNDTEVWQYINQFAEFNNYINSPIANYRGKIFNMPFNMNTFCRIWGISSPKEAIEIIDKQRREIKGEPKNLEEQAISLVGRDIYEKLVKGYTEKQWGRDCKDLPTFIIKRLPVRFTFDNNYFYDRYQGIPIGGYTSIVQNMLEGVEVHLNTDFFDGRKKWSSIAENIVYTGPIDAYFDYCLGHLEYRSLIFKTEVLDIPNYQGVAVMNYTDSQTPYTRCIEHKHFEFNDQPKTVISYEYSIEWKPGNEPYYPINDERNQALYHRYKALADRLQNVIFGGRLGEYKYYDMDKAILSALTQVKSVLKQR